LLNPVFREFYSERDVVHEERRLRYENTAAGQAQEALEGLLFTAHPYGVPVIGWPHDIQRLLHEDARAYFTSYYSPSNCLMALVGDLEVAQVERLARKYFGPWKPQEFSRPVVTAEPEQNGARRAVVEFDARPQLRMGWRTVAEGHADQYALDLLSMILGGLDSSRIDETIVQRDRLATLAGSGHPTRRYGGYLSAWGVLAGERSVGELEQAIEREIERIRSEGVKAEELERAKVAVEASRVAALKSNLGQAFRILNSVYLTGGTDYMEGYEERIGAVTAEQVRDAARRYLVPKRLNVVEVRRVSGAGAPEMGAGARADVAHRHEAEPVPRGTRHSPGFEGAMARIRGAGPLALDLPEVGKQVQRVELEGGTIVFLERDASAPSVSIEFAWLGGSNSAPVEALAPFELAGDLLDEGGTEALAPLELQARKDALGMEFSISIGRTQSRATFWSLSRNFREAFDLALDVVMRPRFDAERLSTLKGQYVEDMRRRDESPGRAASILLDHVIYGGHERLGWVPSRRQIESVTAEQIREVWKRHLGRDNLYLTVVGDFSESEMLALLRQKFDPWREAAERERRWVTHAPFLRPGVHLVDKEIPQPAVRIFHEIAVDRRAKPEEHAALEILNDILGGSGFRSRLMERLRSDEGLTYGIYSGLDHQGRPGVPGSLSIGYQTKKDSVARSIDSVLAECRKILGDLVSEAEVQEQIEAWRNRFVFRYTNDFAVVSRLMNNELDDRPFDFDRRELEQVQKVTPQDVQRAAKKYLRPEQLTVAVFGTLSEADRKALDERFPLRVLAAAEVFPGGY
jgi:predicted Zn-dependent peptidase